MRLWMIGCGNMGGAMLARWIDAGVVRARDVFVANRADRAFPEGVMQGRDLPSEGVPDVVVLGVKPQQLPSAAALHASRVPRAPVLVSMLAGVDARALGYAFPGPVPVSCMPNLPVAFGQGVVPLFAPDADASVRAVVDRLMAPLGLVVWCEDARRYEAVGAVSGTGPAFLFRFVDAVAAAAQSLGVAPHEAESIALATVTGAATMAAADPRSPAVLADAVASPGGMTRAGLDVLDDDRALAALMERTLAAVRDRGRAMAAAVSTAA